MSEVKIMSLSDLFRIYEKKVANKPMYFRGQVCDWALKPSLVREDVIEQEQVEEREAACFEKLKKMLPTFNDWECAAIAQHYGIPTRLLDWSENPLVGLYFALENKRQEGRSYADEDGVLWVFEDKTAVAGERAALYENEEDNPRRLTYPRPYRACKNPKLKYPRTIAQLGALTSQPDLLTEFNKQKFDQNTQSLEKLIVPADSKKRLLKQLNILGVTEKRLFPDFLDIGEGRPIDLVGGCMRIRCELF